MVINDGFGIDAEGVIHGREEFGRVDRVFGGAAAGFIGFAMDVATLDARPGDD